MDLFEKGKKQKGMSAGGEKETPLADRMRPEISEECVGHKHVLGKGSVLRRRFDPTSFLGLTAPRR
jgi:replication-associated recombination protein RarA